MDNVYNYVDSSLTVPNLLVVRGLEIETLSCALSEALFMCGILLLITQCGNARSGLNVNRWETVSR